MVFLNEITCVMKYAKAYEIFAVANVVADKVTENRKFTFFKTNIQINLIRELF